MSCRFSGLNHSTVEDEVTLRPLRTLLLAVQNALKAESGGQSDDEEWLYNIYIYYICTICINVKLVSLQSMIPSRNSWISEVGGKRIDICSHQSDGEMDGSWWLNLLKRLGSVDHNASCRHTRQIHPCPSRLQNKQSPLSMTTRSCRSRILGVLNYKIWIDKQRQAENIKNKEIEYSILIGSSCISFCRHSLLRFGRYRPLHNSCN